MDSSILRRLDEIERLEPDWSTRRISEVSVLMQAFAERVEELGALIARYAASPNEFITQHLACLLAQKAESPTSGIMPLLAIFVQKLHRNDHPETLMNTMTALLHSFHYSEMEQLSADLRRAIFSFVQHGLNYTSRHSVIIQGQALALLSVLRHRNCLEKVFNEDQVNWLRHKVIELRQLRCDALEDELKALEDFTEQ